MKQFEDEVVVFLKPILSEMGPCEISRAEQRQLVGWISLIAILAEWAGSGKHAITRAELKYFKRFRLPPDNWSVFIGGNDGVEWMKRYAYHNATINTIRHSSELPLENDGQPTRNTQITTIGVGNLLFQIFSSADPRATHSYRLTTPETGMVKIWPQGIALWPFTRQKLKLPPSVSFDDQQAYELADMFREKMKILFGA
jgi:hypothetical protein